MRVMRINFSHATFEEAELRLANLRAVSLLFVGDARLMLLLSSFRDVV